MAKKFLPNVSTKRLRDLEKNEKDPKTKTILLACIARKEGKRIVEIARMLNRHYNTVQRWLTRVSEGGLKRRYDIKNRGADCKLSDVQIRQLLKTLDAGPGSAGYETNLWTMNLVHAYIKSEFGVEYHPDSIWQLLHRLEFRPVNPRSATPEEVEAFKKKAQRMATHWSRKGHRILVMDEAHVHLKIVPRTTWTRAKNPTIPTSGMWDRGRVTIMGVIGDDGLNYFDFCDTGNWENTKMFLLKVYAEFGRTLIFMDNASYHIARELVGAPLEGDRSAMHTLARGGNTGHDRQEDPVEHGREDPDSPSDVQSGDQRGRAVPPVQPGAEDGIPVEGKVPCRGGAQLA